MKGMLFKIVIEKSNSTSKLYAYDDLDDEYPINVNLVYNTVVDESIEYMVKLIVKYFYCTYFNIKFGMYAGMQPFVKYSIEELGI